MWLALEATKGDVVEMGCGGGSTPALNKYCTEAKRNLYSFDSDKDWLNKYKYLENDYHKLQAVTNWDTVSKLVPNPSVVLIDHSPGERRIVDVERYKNIDGILILHDTQPQPTAADYKYETIWKHFKYRVDLRVEMNREAGHNRTWASAVSNSFDVTKWAGSETGNKDYTIK